MEIAFSPTSPGVVPSDLVDLTVEAERLDYRAAWLAEVAGPEAFALGGAIAAATTQMELGIAVVPAATRSPALLAMAAGTMSGLLRGRTLALGVGASSEIIVRSWHDRDFALPLGRVADSVRATRALLSGERSYSGDTVTVDRFRLATPPSGRVRLFVGALGVRMLRLAGELGDGVCLNLMTANAVHRQLAEVKAGAAAVGRQVPDDFGVMARFHVVVTDDPAEGRQVIRAGFGPYFAQPVYNSFLGWMGFAEEARAILKAFAAGDRAGVAAALHDDLIDEVALVGPPGRIRERLEEYADAGIGVGALGFLGSDTSGIATALRALAPDRRSTP